MAAEVNLATAQATARDFLSRHATTGRKLAASPHVLWTHSQVSAANAALADYYIINTDAGFVIVAGDDRATSILAYGDAPMTNLNAMPQNMRYWLSLYQRQMEYLYAHPGIKVEAPSRAGQTVTPLLSANWSQDAPYWNECPVYGNDTCYTGCPATSLAMVFHYWKYPRQQTPAVPSYLSPSYDVTLQELPPTIFDWAHMLDDYSGNYTDEQAAAVAHLMRYIGQAEEMDYTISGSGAYGKDVLKFVALQLLQSGARQLTTIDHQAHKLLVVGYGEVVGLQYLALQRFFHLFIRQVPGPFLLGHDDGA
jgi:hypothetical protein